MFVCIRSQQMVKGCVFGGFDCEMCFVRVPVWLLRRHFFFFFQCGEKNYNTASALAVCVVCTLEATVLFGQVKSVCIRDGG